MEDSVRADICEGGDEESIAILRKALGCEGATLMDKGWALGVDQYQLKIGNGEISGFIDAWSCDVEGRQEVVDRIQRRYEQLKASSRA
jgi:hypothetical protein